MKRFLKARWPQRLIFFFAGLTFMFVCVEVSFRWFDVVLHLHGGIPPLPKALKSSLLWLPWIGGGVLLVLGLAKGRSFWAGFYFLGVVMCWVMLIGWFFVEPDISNALHQRPFDENLWRNPESVEYEALWPPRLCMADDLVKSGRLDGLTRDEVLKLLGEPDYTDFPRGTDVYDLSYILGPARRSLGPDNEYLLIRFREDGKVADYAALVVG